MAHDVASTRRHRRSPPHAPPHPSPPPFFAFLQYVSWVNTNDPEEVWRAEEACARFDHKAGVDMFKGTKKRPRDGNAC